MAEQDYTRRQHGGAQEEIKAFRVETQSPQARCLTAREPLEKADEEWKIPSTADSPKSSFPTAMGETFVLALCGPGSRPFWFSCGTTGEFFAASTSRSCANTSKPSGTTEPLLRPLD
jgi:hypothetical protein